MKKILIVTTKFPLPLFSGDKLRIYNISKHLSKKNKVDLVTMHNATIDKKKTKHINKLITVKTNVIMKYFNIIYFLFRGKPLQVGYFFSSKMKDKINSIHKNYDVIIFHLIRSAEYLPKNFKGIKILEMTDLISRNYSQLLNELSIFNPLTYLYFLEKKLLQIYENKILNSFNKIVLVSKEDVKFIDSKKKIKSRINIISNGTDFKKKFYQFKKRNNNVIFIGNINYLPNKIACFEFIKKIMPRLETLGVNVNLIIIGQTSLLLKLELTRFKNVKVYNNVKFPEKLCSNAICGISNLNVSTGIQNKILEYMRIGLPSIISKKCFKSLNLLTNNDVLVYKNYDDFAKKIIKLKTNKIFSNKISSNCYNKILNNFSWTKQLKKYHNII